MGEHVLHQECVTALQVGWEPGASKVCKQISYSPKSHTINVLLLNLQQYAIQNVKMEGAVLPQMSVHVPMAGLEVVVEKVYTNLCIKDM